MTADPMPARRRVRISRRALLGTGAGAAAAVGLAGVASATDALAGGSREREISATNGARVAGAAPPTGQRVVWSVATDAPVVALTFDDGPSPAYTPGVLAALAAAGARATFFVVGESAAANASLVADIVAAGHEVGTHTWSHPDLSRTDAAETARQLSAAFAAVVDATGVEPRWFRPPWGHLTGGALRVAAELRQDVLLWSATATGSASTPIALADEVLPRLVPGCVLLLHDGVRRGTRAPLSTRSAHLRGRRELEVAALPRLLDRAAARGTRFVTATELVGAGATP